MALPEYKVSDKPVTLWQLILTNTIARDARAYEAMLQMIVERTTITEDEAKSLELSEASEVLEKVIHGLKQGDALARLSRAFDGTDSGSD